VVTTEEVVTTTTRTVEAPRPAKFGWEVGKVYRHKVTGYVTDFHVEVVNEDGTEAQGWFPHRTSGDLVVETRRDRENFTPERRGA